MYPRLFKVTALIHLKNMVQLIDEFGDCHYYTLPADRPLATLKYSIGQLLTPIDLPGMKRPFIPMGIRF